MADYSIDGISLDLDPMAKPEVSYGDRTISIRLHYVTPSTKSSLESSFESGGQIVFYDGSTSHDCYWKSLRFGGIEGSVNYTCDISLLLVSGGNTVTVDGISLGSDCVVGYGVNWGRQIDVSRTIPDDSSSPAQTVVVDSGATYTDQVFSISVPNVTPSVKSSLESSFSDRGTIVFNDGSTNYTCYWRSLRFTKIAGSSDYSCDIELIRAS